MKNKVVKRLLVAIALLQLFGLEARSQGIEFEKSLTWEEIKAKARQENRYIFLDMYTTWCGPCKLMDQDVYSQRSIGDFFNPRFISVKIQLDSTAHDGEYVKSWYRIAQQLGKLYDIKAYPSYIFLEPSGELVNKQTGLMSVNAFFNLGNEALDPAKQYPVLLKAYNSGKRTPEFVRSFIRLSKQVDQKVRARTIAQEYISGLTDEQMLDKENIWCLYENTKNITDRGFAFFRDKGDLIEKIEPKIGKKYSDALVISIIRAEAIDPFSKSLNGKTDWKRIDSALIPFGALGQQALKSIRHDLIYESEILPVLENRPTWKLIHQKIESYKEKYLKDNFYRLATFYYLNAISMGKIEGNSEFINVANTYLTQDESVDAMLISNICWLSFERFNDKKDLVIAAGWAKMGLIRKPDLAELNDTYANILYKMGETQQALEWQKKAVQLSPSDSVIKENYEKMQKGIPTWPEPKS